MAQERLLTVSEVARTLQVSKMTVYRLLRRGALPGSRVGRTFQVPAAALAQYLRAAPTDRSA